jgi:archaemetzincin
MVFLLHCFTLLFYRKARFSGYGPTKQSNNQSLMRSRNFAVLLGLLAMGFTPPDEKTIRDAIGDVSQLPVQLQRAFTPDRDAFAPIPTPAPGDWLAGHQEQDQTFEQFKASSPNRPAPNRNIIYFQPLGDFAANRSPSLEQLREFAAAFFAMEIKTLPSVPIENFPTRRNPFTHNPQILTTDVLRFVKARVPADAFCVLAITMEDLYPEASWNFVFGQASLRDLAGVYSFARYDPAFYGEARTSGYKVLLLRRSCKVLAHETSHMFGLTHCTFFNCLMNGSNHLAESDRRPLHLCPVCLRKLQWISGFDVLARYSALEQFNRAAGFSDEAEWLKAQIQKIRADNN